MDAALIAQAEQLSAEIRRRKMANYLAEVYRPSSYQDRLHKSGAFIRLGSAANGCGKSHALVAEGVSVALGFRPWDGSTVGLGRRFPARVAFVVADYSSAAAEDLIPILDKMIPAGQWQTPEKLPTGRPVKWTLKNGSVIKIISCAQTNLAAEGSEWDFVGFNEPPRRSFYLGLLRGASKTGGRLMFAMTPIGEESAWVYDEIAQKSEEDPDIEVFTGTLWEDSFMPPDAKVRFFNRLDPDEREARAYGRFRALAGRVYKVFNEDIHVLRGAAHAAVMDLVKSGRAPMGCVVDPHDRRPFACAWWVMAPHGEIIFWHEFPDGEFHHEIPSSDLGIEEYAAWFRQLEEGKCPVVWRKMDPNYGVQRRVVTMESIADRFAREGMVFDTDIVDALDQGHVAVKEALGYDRNDVKGSPPKLYVTESCTNLIWSFNRYVWKMSRKETATSLGTKVSAIGKDFMDLVRYTVMSGPAYFDPSENQTQLTEAGQALLARQRLGVPRRPYRPRPPVDRGPVIDPIEIHLEIINADSRGTETAPDVRAGAADQEAGEAVRDALQGDSGGHPVAATVA